MNKLSVTSFKDGDNELCYIYDSNDTYVPLYNLSAIFDVPYNKAEQKITNAHDLYDGYVVKFDKSVFTSSDTLKVSDVKSRSITCLTLAGVFEWISSLDYKRYGTDDPRRQAIIDKRRWIMDTASKVARGKLQLASVIPIGNGKHEQRRITKDLYHIQMQALDSLYPDEPPSIHRRIQENIMTNEVAFGRHERGIRDHVNYAELLSLSLVTISDITLLEQKMMDINDRRDVITSIRTKYLPDPKQFPAESKRIPNQSSLETWF